MGLLARQGELVSSASQSSNPLIRNSIGRGSDSEGERIMVNQQTWGLFQTSGFLGRGPVTTEYTLRQEEAAYPKEAHNDWVAAMVERGVLGFAGILLLALEVVVLGLTIWNPSRLKRDLAEVLHERPLWTLFGVAAAFRLWGKANRWSLGRST